MVQAGTWSRLLKSACPDTRANTTVLPNGQEIELRKGTTISREIFMCWEENSLPDYIWRRAIQEVPDLWTPRSRRKPRSAPAVSLQCRPLKDVSPR